MTGVIDPCKYRKYRFIGERVAHNAKSTKDFIGLLAITNYTNVSSTITLTVINRNT